MDLNKEQTQEKAKIFQTLYNVSQQSQRLHQRCIFIVGNTRTGKSTIHNLIMDPQVLVGFREKGNTFYVLRDPTKQTAYIKYSFKSVTITPNISELRSRQDKISLVDLAGLDDRRKGIEVIKVNYINAQFFQTAKTVKFILVFGDGALNINNGGFKNTLQNFLSLFNFEKFSPEEKLELFSSIAFCFTSVNLEGMSKEQGKFKYLEKLKFAIQDLEEWYLENPTQMPTFKIAKQLVQKIIEEKRIQLFQLAVDKKSPEGNWLLQNFDKCSWKYMKLREKINKFTFHFDKQYQGLEKDQRKFVDENIAWRFSFTQVITTVVGSMLKKIINNLGKKQTSIDEELATLSIIMKDLPKYKKLDQIHFNPQYCTADQQLRCFQLLDDSVKKVNDFATWREANKKAPLSEFFTVHIASIMKVQFAVIRKLFGYSSHAQQIFRNLQANFNKMLEQAAIFSLLSPEQESKLKVKFVTDSIFGNQIGSIEQINQNFIEHFHNQSLQANKYTIEELENIIKTVKDLEDQSKSMNPTTFFWSQVKLRHLLADKYRANNAKLPLFVKEIYFALLAAAKLHLLIALHPLSSTKTQLQDLIEQQNKILRQSNEVFHSQNAISQLRNNTKLQSFFKGFDSSKSQNELKYNIWNIFEALSAFLPNNVASSYDKQIEDIISQYRSVMMVQINEEKLNIETPNYQFFTSQVQYYNRIKQQLKGNKAIFVLGELRSGKSLIIQILKGRKITKDKEGRFDVEKPSKFSKINHKATSNQLPHLSLLKEGQLIVEIPSFHGLLPHEMYKKMSLLLELMESTSQFRILMVFKEATLILSKESKEKPFESLFISLVNMLLLSSKKEQKKPKKSVVTLVVTHASSDKPACRQIIEGIVGLMKIIDEKAARYLGLIKQNNQYVCESIQKTNLIAQDLLKKPIHYFKSSKLDITKEDLYTEFVSDKELFLKEVEDKISLIKQVMQPLATLASQALQKFVERKTINQEPWLCEKMTEILQHPKVREYRQDQLSLPIFQSQIASMNNRQSIYHRLVKLCQLGREGIGFELNDSFQKFNDYMDLFFKTMIFPCCSNLDQYENFMNISTLFENLLKELQHIALILTKQQSLQKEGKGKQKDMPQSLQKLKDIMWARSYTDIMATFPDITLEKLMINLLKEKPSYLQEDQRRNVQILSDYVKRYRSSNKVATSAKIQKVVTSAYIELLAFLQRQKRKKIDIDWDKELTEQRLINEVFKHQFIKNNFPKELKYGLFETKKTVQVNRQVIRELLQLKKTLLTESE